MELAPWSTGKESRGEGGRSPCCCCCRAVDLTYEDHRNFFNLIQGMNTRSERRFAAAVLAQIPNLPTGEDRNMKKETGYSLWNVESIEASASWAL